MIAMMMIILAVAAAVSVTAAFSITHYARYATAKLAHAQEMARLRETSDEGAHRRYIEMRKLEDEIAQPENHKMKALDARAAEAQAAADAAKESLERYHSSSRRY